MNHSLSLAIYAINLDRSVDRWETLESNFSGLPYALHRIAALDAAFAPEKVLAVRGLHIALPPSGLGWSMVRQREYLLVQEACFASHLVALQQFLHSTNDLALILEDDAVPSAALPGRLAEITRLKQPFDIIKLEGLKSGRRLAVARAQLSQGWLVNSLRPSAGSAAYVITRAAAEKLMQRAGKLLLPYDDYLSNPALTGCDIWHCSPLPIHQSDAPSLIAQSYARDALRRRRGPLAYLRQARTRAGLRWQLWNSALRRGGSIPRNFEW
ncbi:glycosyltransferase family 25 protein [Aureimonas fodinaquatilis]|uniref:glycosyltransferase family 25 protein n=1 Tax=Aureimonas fodinaquatilis TaxID=2565783 RepID=UPI001AEE8742|nr:glycosyltransferase family 25 protein [Aureimonas fodinaquatilis]